MSAIITGASSGIGYELAKQFAQNKIDVFLVARNNIRLREIAEDFKSRYGIKAEVCSLDLASKDAALVVYNKIKEIGWVVDYVVNNAGFGDYGYFTQTSWENEYSMINVNIIALTQLCKLFIPGMILRGHGNILNIASTAAFFPGPFMSVYFATKAYVLSFSQAIRSSLKGTGVTVTTFCPGPTKTNFESVAHATSSKLFKGKLASAEHVATHAYKAMLKKRNVVICGFSNKALVFLSRFVPRTIVLMIVKHVSR